MHKIAFPFLIWKTFRYQFTNIRICAYLEVCVSANSFSESDSVTFYFHVTRPFWLSFELEFWKKLLFGSKWTSGLKFGWKITLVFRICPNYVFEILQPVRESQVNKIGQNFFSEWKLIEQKWGILIQIWAQIMTSSYGWQSIFLSIHFNNCFETVLVVSEIVRLLEKV